MHGTSPSGEESGTHDLNGAPGRARRPSIRLEPWTDAPSGLELLRLCNAPEMTAHLGGPESEEQLVARHRRYASMPGESAGRMYRVVLETDGTAVGTTGYWESSRGEETAYETGWGILPAYQGRGLASAAVAAVVAEARAARGHRFLDAFPSVDNVPSNAVCRSNGFSLLGEYDVEYPKGSFMRSNIWRLDLDGAPPSGSGGTP
ncbi:GNAT family N-acetyltransferase [Streptomyces sp. I05A-00742]|uniref:GNAT family N-acetyltransferase n=1 Tax=Streptomyces sp. I05A-00742 TaxID=2732853 RepID=UPI001487DC9E|nr:GNAT family protein [Streptomyces sp. I05A-00742]